MFTNLASHAHLAGLGKPHDLCCLLPDDSGFIFGMSYQLLPGFVAGVRATAGWPQLTIADLSLPRYRGVFMAHCTKTATKTHNCDACVLHRRADDHDLIREGFRRRRESEAQSLCLEKIHHYGLPMKLVKVEHAFDAGKILFYFVSEGRVDFRELVRDLAQGLRVRIEMKQIGARDEAQLVGGIGSCGRELCCSTWLKEFPTVSVKMAKDQGLLLNSSKLAGQCGRLKCCLRYEYATYQEMGKNLPAVGTAVMSVKGDGRVTCQNVLKQTVMIRRGEDGIEIEATLADLVEKRAEPPHL